MTAPNLCRGIDAAIRILVRRGSPARSHPPPRLS